MPKKLPNILWITLDACRKDRLSCYGYHKKTTPYLEKICKKAIVFENAFANAPWTLPSITSMFTGLYPLQHRVLNETKALSKSVKTIASILLKRGYKTYLINRNEGFINTIHGTARGFKKVYDTDKIYFSRFNNLPEIDFKIKSLKKLYRLVPIFFSKLLQEDTGDMICHIFENIICKNNKPFFVYIHLTDTHFPYLPPVKYQKFGNRKKFPILPGALLNIYSFYANYYERRIRQWAGFSEYSKEEFEIFNFLYDACILYSDHQINNLITLLEDYNLIDETVILITADHGENIGDYNTIDHVMDIHNTLLNVPLIIIFPYLFKEETHITDLFELKDLFHLLLDIIESPPDEDLFEKYKREYVFGSYSVINHFFKKIRRIRPRRTFHQYGRFILNKKFKYIKYDDGVEELYYINRKEEKINPDEQKEMTKLLREKLRENTDTILKEKLIKDKIKRLKKLGKI